MVRGPKGPPLRSGAPERGRGVTRRALRPSFHSAATPKRALLDVRGPTDGGPSPDNSWLAHFYKANASSGWIGAVTSIRESRSITNLLCPKSLTATPTFYNILKHSRECTRVCSPRMTHPALCPVFILGVRQGGNERLVRRTRPQLLEKPCARCAWMMTKSQILLFPVPNPVPSVGNFKRAQKGHSS